MGMTEPSEIGRKIDQLKSLSSGGRLPSIGREEQDSFYFRFQVEWIKNDLPSHLGFWVILIFAILFSFPVAICFLDAAGSHAARVICVFLWGFLFLVAFSVRRAKNNLLSDPVLLKVYQHGIWINKERAFIPYERLLKIETTVVSMKGMKYRSIYFSSFGDDEHIQRYMLSDSGLSMSYGDILDKIYEFATENNAKLGLAPPLLLIEGVEMTADEFNAMKSV